MADDLFVRRSADDYAQAFEDLHPVGPAWPRAHPPVAGDDTPRGDREALSDITRGIAKIWAQVDGRAADLLFTETDPRLTYDMLSDWERAFGLPDPCNAEVQNLQLRHDALIRKLTQLGRQDIPFFVQIATDLGYRIKVFEYRPIIGGITMGGETRPNATITYTWARGGLAQGGVSHHCEIAQSKGDDWIWRGGAPNLRYLWRVSILNTALRWARGGAARGGIDHHCEFGLATDLECLIRRLKPGHTEVIFDYSQVTTGNG